MKLNVHLVAKLNSLRNVYRRSNSLLSAASKCPSLFVLSSVILLLLILWLQLVVWCLSSQELCLSISALC
jgi:hypothetical protein